LPGRFKDTDWAQILTLYDLLLTMTPTSAVRVNRAVLTTGGAVRDATFALRSLGATVEVVLCAIDPSGQLGGPVADVGLETRSVFTSSDLDTAHTL